MNTIVYQGVKGAFSYITAIKAFGSEHTFMGEKTFADVFNRLDDGLADYAVIPIENSLAGSIYENYDLLSHSGAWIVDEHYTKIEHCLLAVIPVEEASGDHRLKKIRKVLSHPKALEQCKEFFKKYPWIEAVAHSDTAGAAAEIAVANNPEHAAIASSVAGSLYGLDVLQEGIEDDPANYTRFLVVAKKISECNSKKKSKGSFLLEVAHVPGILAAVLNCLAGHGMNLTKIESRPLQGRPFEYRFYVDFEFPRMKLKKVEDVLAELYEHVQTIKILGLY